MSKFYGVVGFCTSVSLVNGVSNDVITEYNYAGDIIKNNSRLQPTDAIVDDLKLDNLISIMADPYALGHFYEIRYVVWMEVYWKVTKVELQRPRLILTIGGVYNGVKATAPDDA